MSIVVGTLGWAAAAAFFALCLWCNTSWFRHCRRVNDEWYELATRQAAESEAERYELWQYAQSLQRRDDGEEWKNA